MSMMKEFVNRLREKSELFSRSDFAVAGIAKDYKDCADIIEQLSEKLSEENLSENLTSWIPCDERLPEEEGNYIVTFDDGYMSSVPFYGEDWVLWGDSGDPVAWMQLPEPYKGE